MLQIETAADAADGDDKHLPPDMIECAPSTQPSPASHYSLCLPTLFITRLGIGTDSHNE